MPVRAARAIGAAGAAVFTSAFPASDRVALLAALNGGDPASAEALKTRIDRLTARLDRARAAYAAATNAPKVIADTKARVDAVLAAMGLNR